MAKSDEANTPTGQERSLFLLLRESGEALETASPPFDAAAGAARLREAARAHGLLRPDDTPEKDLAVTGANLEEEAPPFDVEAGAARLREAAHARGLLSDSASGAFGEAASQTLPRKPEVVSHSDAQARTAAQEAQLVARIADGNIEEPLRELYRRYAKNLYRFGLHMLGDEGLAEEMVQETFVRLWRSARRYEPDRGSVGAYLFVIARSTAADIRKRPSSRPLPVEDSQLPPLPDSTDQILDSLMLRDAIDKLSTAHAEVLRLVLEEGLTPSEIAKRLNLPLGTIKTRMYYSMRALRSALGERVSMPPKGKADLAHPEAADWVLGTLGPEQAEDFQRHLTSCLHCQTTVAEFGQLGQMLQHLPPAAELPPGLEARVLAAAA